MIAFAPWQALLNAIGWVIAQIYNLIPNYGVTIIVLTVLIRVVLLPLGIKQIRSMQHMQIVQPKVKQIQQKYKQNKQKQQEEIMKLYKEYGVNPFSGCWPVLLQFPILIAMYSVLRHPQHPIHIPAGTDLYNVIQQQIPQPPDPDKMAALPGPPGGTSFLTMNLLCSATQAGNPNAELADTKATTANGEKVVYPVDCGDNAVDRIPYYIFALLMFGTTYYQQRQMQKASPPGAASQQQQALLRIMPIMFGVFGIFFPSGLVVYWTTSNAWQIGQQYYMLRSRPTAETLASRAAEKNDQPSKKGFLGSMMERAEQERKRKDQVTRKPSRPSKPSAGGSTKPTKPSGGSTKPTKPSRAGSGSGKPTKPSKPATPPPSEGTNDGSDPDDGS